MWPINVEPSDFCFRTVIVIILSVPINLLYTGGLFHCYMLDEFICCFRAGPRSAISRAPDS